MPKREKKAAPPQVSPEYSDSNDDDDSDGDGDSDSSGDSSVSDARMSGHQRSDSETDSEPDAREQFLLPSFQPKPVRSTVSVWAKRTLRDFFLGLPMSKKERLETKEEYYCSPGDYKEFSAPTINGECLKL